MSTWELRYHGSNDAKLLYEPSTFTIDETLRHTNQAPHPKLPSIPPSKRDATTRPHKKYPDSLSRVPALDQCLCSSVSLPYLCTGVRLRLNEGPMARRSLHCHAAFATKCASVRRGFRSLCSSMQLPILPFHTCISTSLSPIPPRGMRQMRVPRLRPSPDELTTLRPSLLFPGLFLRGAISVMASSLGNKQESLATVNKASNGAFGRVA